MEQDKLSQAVVGFWSRREDASVFRLSNLRRISDRQLECLAWAREGKSAGDIAVILGISHRTVEGHFLKACGHLGVKTRVQAVIRAMELGLLGH